jgi:hypothetical protein
MKVLLIQLVIGLACVVLSGNRLFSSAAGAVRAALASAIPVCIASGPAFLGTLQFAHALAVEFAGGARPLGITAATLARPCLLLLR